jgi:hypothetical protein
MFTRDDIKPSFDATWQDLLTSAHGVIDKVVTDRMIKVSLRLWGAWENVAVLFPTALLNPTIGTRIFGTTDLPLIIHKKTGGEERITIHNAQITKLADLYIGVDNNIFAADVEFTGLIKNNTDPETALSYYTIDTAVYADTTFVKTNYAQRRAAAVWGAAPFDAFQAHKGWNIGWTLGLTPEYNANVGTVDMILTGFMGAARCIPLGPTVAQIEARMLFQGAGNPLGSLLSDGDDDLVITPTTPAGIITLKGACITQWSPVFGSVPLLNGEVVWETTRGFTAGVAAAIATAA